MAKIAYPDKIKLAQALTPIQRIRGLSEKASKFGEVNIYVKRDDLTHGPAAGNKVRKLEFLMAEALKRKAKVVLTCGGVQSNHARATALMARELGMEPVLFLRGERPSRLEGNLLIDALLGSRIIFVSPEQYDDIGGLFHSTIDSYRAEGVSAYAIPEGGSNDLGVAGYVSAMEEIASQCGTEGLPGRFDSIVCATGSGGTYAGLVLGRNLLGWDVAGTRCVTFNVLRDAAQFRGRVMNLMIAAVQRMRWPVSFMAEDIDIVDGYVGPGYAQTTPELMALIASVARTDGLLLDPVYTGKAMLGLMTELTASKERAARFGRNVLFVHTGGMPGLFASQRELAEAITHV